MDNSAFHKCRKDFFSFETTVFVTAEHFLFKHIQCVVGLVLEFDKSAISFVFLEQFKVVQIVNVYGLQFCNL